MKYNLINCFKKYIWILIPVPFLINFINNLIQGKITIFNYYFESKFLIFIFLLNISFYLILSKYINKSLKLESLSLSLCYFLSSYFLFDYLALFLLKDVLYTYSFYVVSIFWYVLIFFKNKSIKEHIFITFIYILILLINNRFFDYLSNLKKYIQLNTDVPVQWFPMAQNIHSKNYFFSFTNNLIDGHGLYLSHIQSTLFKINFPLQEFEFSRISTNLQILFAILIFFDLKILQKNKIYLSIGFIVYALNSGWLTYLLFDSLMLEGLISFIFGVYLYHSNRHLSVKLSRKSLLFFILFSALFESKEFLSTLGFIYILYLFIWKRNFNACGSIIIFGIQYLYSKLYTYGSSEFAYLDGRGPLDLIVDILNFENIDLNVISKIINQFYIDRVTTYIFICFILISLVRVRSSYHKVENKLLTIVVMNIIFILILYTNWWKNIEIESSFRYFLNSIYLIFIVIGLKVDKLSRL